MRRPELTVLGCHHGFGCRLSGPRSKLHSLVRLSGPFLGADRPPAERRAQVLSRMPLAAPARSAGSSWTRPSTALCLSRLATSIVENSDAKSRLPVIPGDRNELVECHSEATRGRSPVSPDRPTKIVLRRSVESAKNTLATVQSIAAQTLRGSRLARQVQDILEGRLLALANAHDRFTQARW